MWVCARDCIYLFVQHLVLNEHYHFNLYVVHNGGSWFSFCTFKFVTPWISVGLDPDISSEAQEIPRFVINKN